MDQGLQTFQVELIPHTGTWQESRVVRAAEELVTESPLYQGIHPGFRRGADSFLSVDAPDVVVETVKQAEDGGDLIVRSYETSGRTTTATITLNFAGTQWTGEYHPFEIKTLRIDRPSGEHRFTVLDDLDEASLARLSADGFDPCALDETSPGNFQAWLRHAIVFPKLLGTFAAQTLAARHGADPSAADWRRFGRLPGFTNCKPKYRRLDGFFPFVRLKIHTGEQYPMAEAFEQEVTQRYKAREQEREARRQLAFLSPRRGPRLHLRTRPDHP